MNLNDAKRKLPELPPEEFNEDRQSFKMKEQTEALIMLGNGWSIIGWAYTNDLPLVCSEKYTCLFQQGERKIWFQLPEDEFEEIAAKLK